MVVDDDHAVRQMLTKALENWGAQVKAFPGAPSALRTAETERFDVVITDIRMPDMDGHEFLRKLKVLDPELDVLMVTAYGSIESAVRAMRDGAADYLMKPFSLEELFLKLERICRTRHLRDENRSLRNQLREGYDVQKGARLIGSSPSMQAIYRTIEAVASNRSNVLIQGETGTGKELVAKAIHHSGPRAEKPFIALTCGSTSKTLLESQLFGHVKGAFTGAVRDSPGYFLAAAGGTLFLDEITEVDTEIQAKLLRVLQEREVTPVGGTRPVPVDVRFIAATNRDALEAVEKGLLRQDLYYRLSVVVIRIPPLRERREDIRSLVEYFNSQLSEEYGVARRQVSEEAMAILEKYRWPGNVRQLQNVVERAFALGEGPVILPEHLPPEVLNGDAVERSGGAGGLSTLRESEAELLRRTLQACGWNKSDAARRLGIDRKRLYRMMRRHGLLESAGAPAPAADRGGAQ